MTDNRPYAPSGNVLCSCPMCGPRLEQLVRQHVAHSIESLTRRPLDRERTPSPSTPLPGIWYGFDETA